MTLLNLIKNENMKLYRQRSTYFIYFITYLLTFILFLIQKVQGSLFLTSFWETSAYVIQLSMQIFFILTIVVAIQIISSEFADGTMKTLLISPHSRSKILLSKYIAVLLFSLRGIVGSILLGCVTAAIFIGLKGVDQLELFLSVFSTLLLKLLTIPLFVSVAFMFVIVTRNIGLTLLICLPFSIITVNFIPAIPGLSLPISTLIWTIFYVIFTNIGWSQFKKQDI